MKQGQTTVPLNGAHSLWNSVIAQAIDDATHWINTDFASHKILHLNRSRARKWLTPSDDFDTVCNLAGLEPHRVRAYAEREIAKANANPPKRKRTPGVVANFPSIEGDRPTPTAQKIEEIDFSQNTELTPCQ